ncbi:methylated-DNA--[protein]-cysteine S-methyltransferase [Campylobacter sp. MIT 21-1685]|uniref:methylated-DNA--[protein]-cysteine S-methyltransferase n=1 Tax=unclassified Campylobacter TaxID=2593542 RepID=UPI00224A6CEE|nr:MULTISPECIES: methylated-DNA--[protein]-cysteine S-methyltransferase [unclassified Campylobacter]MCX2682764.1 methylated-DNA--[protein]-cysteine S-methyltransferase [Campylobacter sp. MIT 21-1684]MCX2751090.1 methylated-DNA--[protein]-cysteine S-methyltransferase [Campylobacter sp. MIT 21-1682]MCX2807245.1 methylated-DNA--[protein]-cysteine S-methyltransferase [Campylobacter sp. MIT 21-1685]
MFKIYYKSPICYLSLHSNGNSLTELSFCQKTGEVKSCEVLEQAKAELELYFSGRLQEFKTPLLLQGTVFERKVYKALQEIPYGQTATYKEIAEKIGYKNAYRAVGNANSKNKLPLFIPCHRIVASNGIGGYSGGLNYKTFLLKLEKYCCQFKSDLS